MEEQEEVTATARQTGLNGGRKGSIPTGNIPRHQRHAHGYATRLHRPDMLRTTATFFRYLTLQFPTFRNGYVYVSRLLSGQLALEISVLSSSFSSAG